MDTASNLPFKLQLIKRFPVVSVQDAINFSMSKEELWNKEIVTLVMEENDEVEILFDSSNTDDRLYLDALDIMPINDENIRKDEEGHIYRLPSNKPFVLYKSNSEYDALRVDVFMMSIFCNGTWYYGTFQVLPKPMSISEWNMMKNDLESEIQGLAQDIVRRNIGIGHTKNGDIPSKALYQFFVIKSYAKKVLAALIDIAENPRYKIITQYETVSSCNNYSFDAETVKRYVMRSGSEPTYKIPVKVTYYDIQDNRLLKMIIKRCEKSLDYFLDLLGTLDNDYISSSSSNTLQYKNVWNDSIIEFRQTALKLRRMTSIIKTKDWYMQVSDISQAHIPHSFILDSRYNNLYQMYLDLEKNEIQVQLDSEFSYTWKRSSYLYEMWCYLKLCRILLMEFDIVSPKWNFIFSDKILIPFLKSGTTINFENKELRIQLIFDSILPSNKNGTTLENPLFIAKRHDNLINHNRPDIVINVYDVSSNWYLGSIILECKYRKLNSFWNDNSDRSSRGQFEMYYNNARSEYLYGTLGEVLKSRPVKKVIVLTPDSSGEGKKQTDCEILVKTFKPNSVNGLIDSLQQELMNNIMEMKSVACRLRDI